MDNKSNNPIIQALLDLKGFSENPDFIDALLKESSALYKAAEKFDKHQYPDRVIRYGKITTYKECAAYINLNLKNQNAASLFSVLCNVCISPTNDIAVPMSELQNLTGMSKNTLIAAREALIDNGFLAVIKKSTNRQAAIYRINPMLFGVGKPKTEYDSHDFWDYARIGAKGNFEELLSHDYIVTSNGMVDSENKFLKPTSISKDTGSERADFEAEVQKIAKALKTKKPKHTKAQGS